jgi:hypothetical protein
MLYEGGTVSSQVRTFSAGIKEESESKYSPSMQGFLSKKFLGLNMSVMGSAGMMG